MIAGFQMVEHHIEKLYMENPGVKVSEDDLSLEYFADYRYAADDNGWNGDIVLAVRRSITIENERKPVYEIVITGKFTAARDETIACDNDFIHRLKINGAASIVPIARAVLIATAAMTGRQELYTLPNINVFELKWQSDSKGDNR